MSDSHQKDVETIAQQEISAEYFASYTTLHGFHFTIRGHHPARRIVWSLAMLMMFCFFCREVYETSHKLLAYGTTFSYSSKYEKTLTFPAVSICNMNILKRKEILGKDAQAYLDSINYIIPSERKAKFKAKTFNLEKAIIENGHQLTDMLVKCVWGSRQEKCTAENFTRFFSMTRGICYTFNSGQKGHRLLQASGTGQLYGLTLILKLNPLEYYGFKSYESTGFRVMAHNQGDIPEPVDLHGTICSAGHALDMSLRKYKISRLKTYFHKSCEEDSGYSQALCNLYCKRSEVVEYCGCKLPLKAPENGIDFPEVPHCNLANESVTMCIHRIYEDSDKCKEKCIPKCTQEYYLKSTSVSRYPSDIFWDDVKIYRPFDGMLSSLLKKVPGLGKVFGSFARPLARIQVYYETMAINSRQEIKAYDYEDFVGDLGGFLGLCLGCSILTLGEVIDLIVYWCMRMRDRNRVVAFKIETPKNTVT